MKIVIDDRIGIGRVALSRRGDEEVAQFAIGDRRSVVFVSSTSIVGRLVLFGTLRRTETDTSVVVVVRQYGEQQQRKPCK